MLLPTFQKVNKAGPREIFKRQKHEIVDKNIKQITFANKIKQCVDDHFENTAPHIHTHHSTHNSLSFVSKLNAWLQKYYKLVYSVALLDD